MTAQQNQDLLKFDSIESVLSESGIIFLTYGGALTQALIAGMTDALEKEAENKELSSKVSNNIFVMFIEMAQNMMNYSLEDMEHSATNHSKGLVVVGSNEAQNEYFVLSRNLISAEDRKIIEARLSELEGMDQEQLRKLYRERRRSGRDSHSQGAGIGFIEIARRSLRIEHLFNEVSADKYYFTLKATTAG